MLTQIQIREISRSSGINPYYQEKDYLQNIFLFNLYRRGEGKNFIFKGGTCLKLAYNYTRFSEDLDFNSELKPDEIRKTVREILKSFGLLGIESEFIKEESFEDSYTAKIRFFGPLFSGKIESTNSIQLDIGKRDKGILAPKWVQINPVYPDVPKFLIFAMDEKEILAEKFRALVMRSEPRDIFDIWSMLSANVELKKELIEKKIHKKKFEIKFCTKKEYERDLDNLLPFNLPPYEQVVNDIKKRFSYHL